MHASSPRRKITRGHVKQLPSIEGDGAPKSANLWFRVRCRMRRAPLGAPNAVSCRHRAPLSSKRSNRTPPPVASASSWQGLLVVPGGAPMPPGCLTCVPSPRAPHPVPPHERLMMRPSSGRGEYKFKCELEVGDKRNAEANSPLPKGWRKTRAAGTITLSPPRCPGHPRSSCPPRGSPHRCAGSLRSRRGRGPRGDRGRRRRHPRSRRYA